MHERFARLRAETRRRDTKMEMKRNEFLAAVFLGDSKIHVLMCSEETKCAEEVSLQNMRQFLMRFGGLWRSSSMKRQFVFIFAPTFLVSYSFLLYLRRMPHNH